MPVHDVENRIFRKAAVDHYLSTDDQGRIVRIGKPHWWSLAMVVAAAVGATLLLVLLWHELF